LQGLVGGVAGRLKKARDTTGVLATVSFRAKAPGVSRIVLEDLSLAGDGGQVVSSLVEGASVTVRE